MYYAESNYMDYYLDNMTTTFGIVNMEDRWMDEEYDPSGYHVVTACQYIEGHILRSLCS